MKRICPNPMPWHKINERLSNYAQLHPCIPPSPPKPLILAGWAYSNDVEKMHRWEETVAWAVKNGCSDFLSGIPDKDCYFVEKPTSYGVGPLGGPVYRPWDFEGKSRPTPEEIVKLMEALTSNGSEIVGKEIGSITRPLAFTGEKVRRLLVFANPASAPPWGGWSYLSMQESAR